jgi:hypothetical protein
MILVRPVLIVSCIVSFLFLISCTRNYNDCAVSSYCKDSTVANFVVSNEAKNWWINDSIKTGKLIYKNETGTIFGLYKSYNNNLDRELIFNHYENPVDNGCFDPIGCSIKIKYDGYSMNYYNSVYNFNIDVYLNRRIPKNTIDTRSSNWLEYLEFSNNNKSIIISPGNNDSRFNKNEFFQILTIQNKTYSDVYHVYDSSRLNKNPIQIMGYYFNSTKGIIKYYLNNNEEWTLQ